VIKEMRLADIATLDAANQFLEGYLPIYNRRFAVQPAQVADLHRPRPAHRELDRILCLKTTTACARISPLRIRENSIRIMRRSEPPVCWWKSMGTGRCGSRTRAGRSAFMRSRLGP
jgi:hypothetical protein